MCANYNTAGVASLVNGNFETTCPDYPAPNGVSLLKCLPGWKTTASDGYFEIWATGAYNVPADTPPYFAELNAYVASMIYQDFDVVPGQSFTWSLKHRGREGTDVMDVLIGPPSSMVLQRRITDSNLAWAGYNGAYTVPANVTSIRFGFSAVSTATGNQAVGNFLDSIVMTPVTTACSSTRQNNTLLLDPLASATYESPAILSVTVVPPVNGNATVNANNTITFVPANGFAGTQLLNYTVVDGLNCRATSWINITVVS